jgi:outer membrane translocation and assembly module TamA
MKADVGLVGFTDLGRVWMNGEHSKKWHTGYGGGIYLTPFHSVMLSVVVGLSEEEQLLNASLGSRINMVFQGW